MDNRSGKRTEFLLEGLACPGCALKIEDEIRRLQGVAAVSMDFTGKTIAIEAEQGAGELYARVAGIVKRHEPEIIVREKTLEVSAQKVLLLLGLGCANCAARIEKEVRGIEGVKSASLDFATGRMTVEAHRRRDLDRIVRQAKQAAERIEEGLKVVEHGPVKAVDGAAGRGRWPRHIPVMLAAALFAAAELIRLPAPAQLACFLAAYVLAGGQVLLKAARNILRGRVFDENFLMGVATVGAFAIGDHAEGVAVMLFYQVGEFFQRLAVDRSRRSIGALMDIRPDFANLRTGAHLKKVSPEEVAVGDVIVVKPGEKVPLDGRVVEGASMLDTSALTGESAPREAYSGIEVLSGSINLNGLIAVEVTKEYGQSTVARILDLVQNAGSRKAPTENFITRFSRYYTPAVVAVALALAVIPPFMVPGAVFADWLHRALVFLVVSCPCALVVSIPLGFFGGIGGASRRGILVKGGNYLEALNRVDTVVFDKTGTLTKGVFRVAKIASAGEFSEEALLEHAAVAESWSNHPIAQSILQAWGREVNAGGVESVDEIAGHGVKVKARGREILAGNARLMEREGIPYTSADEAGTVVYLAVDGRFAGHIVIADELKADANQAVAELRRAGVRRVVMLTGDSKPIAESIGRELGLDEVHAELLPDRKVELLEAFDRQKLGRGKLVFAGDGVNDAPALARADVGVAMGGLGSDAAIEAADVVILSDEPSKLADAIRIARRTRAVVWQNIAFAMGVKGLFLLLGAFGVATMWEAVFADVGVALIAVLNAMRAMKA